MGIIIWLIVGGICGWLASLIMRTDAQQGIILNIVVGIVGAVIAGLLFGGSIEQRHHGRELPLFADRRGHPSGDRQPDPPGNGPLDIDAFSRSEERPRGDSPRGLSPMRISLQLERHRQADLELLLARLDLRVGAALARAPSSSAAAAAATA